MRSGRHSRPRGRWGTRPRPSEERQGGGEPGRGAPPFEAHSSLGDEQASEGPGAGPDGTPPRRERPAVGDVCEQGVGDPAGPVI
jgi:hypothetical protein